MKDTVEWIYWVLFVLTITFTLRACSIEDNQKEIIKELKQINSHLEKKNEQ